MANKERNLWSHDVDTKWHPKEGFFEQSADLVAKGLKEASDSYDQAMDRLDFYINRAGDKLSAARKDVLENAKDKLADLYGRVIGEDKDRSGGSCCH